LEKILMVYFSCKCIVSFMLENIATGFSCGNFSNNFVGDDACGCFVKVENCV